MGIEIFVDLVLKLFVHVHDVCVLFLDLLSDLIHHLIHMLDVLDDFKS